MWLPDCRISGRIPRRKDPAAFSRHDDLILHHMKPDESRLVFFLEMTVDRVSHHLTQFFKRLALRENGISERSRSVAAFGRVFDGKNDLLLGHDSYQSSSSQGYIRKRPIAPRSNGIGAALLNSGLLPTRFSANLHVPSGGESWQ